MARKSRIEQSPNFNEILDMIKEGLSSRAISDYLLEEYDEKIAHTTINNYIKKIKSKTSQEYYKKKKKKKTEAVNKKVTNKESEVVKKKVSDKESVDEIINDSVSDLEALDNIISEAQNLKLNINNIKPKYLDNYCVNSEVDIEKLKIQAKRLAIQAINMKSKFLQSEPDTEKIIVPIILDSDEEEKLRNEIENELR